MRLLSDEEGTSLVATQLAQATSAEQLVDNIKRTRQGRRLCTLWLRQAGAKNTHTFLLRLAVALQTRKGERASECFSSALAFFLSCCWFVRSFTCLHSALLLLLFRQSQRQRQSIARAVAQTQCNISLVSHLALSKTTSPVLSLSLTARPT